MKYKERLEKGEIIYIKECDLSVRTERGLAIAGIVTLNDLVNKSDCDLLCIPKFGLKKINEIKDFLADYRLKLPESSREFERNQLIKTCKIKKMKNRLNWLQAKIRQYEKEIKNINELLNELI